MIPSLALRFMPYIVAAVIAFASGWYGGLRWSEADTLRAEAVTLQERAARAAADLVAERARADSAIAARDAAILEQQRSAAASARIATAAAREAQDVRAALDDKERELNGFREELALERSANPSACSCGFSPDQRRRLREKFPISTPARRPVDTAVGQRDDDPVPGSGRVERPTDGGR